MTDPSLDGAAATRTGAVLAAAVAQIGDVDLVLTGDASVDLGAQLVPSVMAVVGVAALAGLFEMVGELARKFEVPVGIEFFDRAGDAQMPFGA